MPLLVSVLLLLSSALTVPLVVGDMFVIESPENHIRNMHNLSNRFMIFDFKKVLITLCIINNYILAHLEYTANHPRRLTIRCT